MSVHQDQTLEAVRRQLVAVLRDVTVKYGMTCQEIMKLQSQAFMYREAYHRGYDTNSVYSRVYSMTLEELVEKLPVIINEIVPGRSRLVVEVNGLVLLEAGNLAPYRRYLRKTYEDARLYTEKTPNDEQEVRLGGVLKASSIRALSHFQARTDPMTGLNNNRVYCEEIEAEVFRAERYEKTLSLAVIDVDNFKLINDTYGHPGGDEALRAIAKLLKEKTRKSDMVARYGGDEFVLILPETPKREAIIHAINIRKAIQSLAVVIGGESVFLTSTIGVATYPCDATNAEGLYSRADEALLEAKARGRNKVRGACSLLAKTNVVKLGG